MTARPTATKLVCWVPAPLPRQLVQIEGVADGSADRLGELYADANADVDIDPPVALGALVTLVTAVPEEAEVDV